MPPDARGINISSARRSFHRSGARLRKRRRLLGKSSSKRRLAHIRVPTLLLNARNDPFLPAAALPDAEEVSPSVSSGIPGIGGHVGFVSGRFPGDLDWLPQRIFNFFSSRRVVAAPLHRLSPRNYGVKTSLAEEKLVPGLGPPEIT